MKKKATIFWSHWQLRARNLPGVPLFLLLLCCSPGLMAQSVRSIQGNVVDEKGNGIPGVTVLIKGTRTGTSADDKGHYIVQVPAGKDTLSFTFIGYNTKDVAIGGKTTINVQMEPTSATLGDVVVVGFGTQKKTSLVSSVTAINPKEIKGPTSNLTTMLAGRISGIVSFQRSGEPGRDNAQFFIRGVATFGTGKVDPLIMIDGVESDNTTLARLQPDDISGFTVLKDATASAIYGARGANGVILITTKLGESGKTKFNVRVENSNSANTKNFNMADNITYMRLANEASLTRNALGAAPYSQNKIDHTAAGDDPLLYPNNDWVDLMLKDHTNNQRYNMNVSGGTDKMQYYLAMTYNVDNGILRIAPINDFNSNIKLRNYSVLSNVTLQLTKTTKALVSVRGQFDDYNGPVGGGDRIISSVLTANPVAFPALYPQSYLPYAQHPLFGNSLIPGTTRSLYRNPYAEAVRGYQQSNNSTLNAKLELNQDMSGITKGLSSRVMAYTTRFSSFDVARQYNPFYYQVYTEDGKTPAGIYHLNNNIPGIGQIGDQAPTEYLDYVPGERKQNTTTYAEAQINYGRTIGAHNVTGMLIGRMFNYLNGGVTSLQESLPKRNLGVSGRFTYGYNDRYLFEANFGYNGTERFAKHNRFGFFPSAGIGWVVSNEKFFEGLRNTVDNLKFRASYGLVGNDQIGRDADRFFFLSQVNLNDASRGAAFGERFGYSRPGISTSRYGNDNVTWEKSNQLNYGMDLVMFKNALSITIDAYKYKRRNILMTRADIPGTMGLQVTPQANTGEASSEGAELAMDYKKNINPNFWITVRGTFTYATNKLLVNEEPEYGPGSRHLSMVGWPLKQRFGLIAERLFIDEKDVQNSPRQIGDYMAGDIKYRDINDDGQITTEDLVPIGLPEYPEIMYGFGFTLGYKSFDLSMFFQGSSRSSFFINPRSISPFILNPINPLDANQIVTNGQSGLLDAIAQDHWSEDNRNSYAFWPRLSNVYVDNNLQSSTWWMQDGSFVRLKTAELGYNFPKGLVRKVGLQSGRLYLNGMNLFTISKFKLWDPEMGGNGLGYPIQRVINVGALIGF